tara:strand:+ start:2395 stop:2853 length:459 start_codon:yes stop_codon:yes gene_type:complete
VIILPRGVAVLRKTAAVQRALTLTDPMHPAVIRALSWSNSQARNKLLKRLKSEEVITASDVANAKLVVQIRHKMHLLANSLASQDRALAAIRAQQSLSRTQFSALCKLACVCFADGKWYHDLATRLKQRDYQVPRSTLKRYTHVRLCMLESA